MPEGDSDLRSITITQKFIYLDRDDRNYWHVVNPDKKNMLTHNDMKLAAVELRTLFATWRAQTAQK